MLIRGRQTTTSSNRVQSQGARGRSLVMEWGGALAIGGMTGSGQVAKALKLSASWFNAEHHLGRF
nr:hypothetical protein FFPRI1PSEUD_30130 [Pseudomonas sp. FFPRI_1]